MDVFPAMFALKGRRVAILGGGETARRKARLMMKAGADLHAFAPDFAADYHAEFADAAHFHHCRAGVADLEGASLVIVAEDDPALATAGACIAKSAGAPVNVVDWPALCDWTTPAIIDRGAVVAAVATGGAAPVLARDIRTKIEALLPQGLGRLAKHAGAFRNRVNAVLTDGEARRAFWERALRGPARERALANDAAGAQAAFEATLHAPRPAGMVHIVGAGPGDPELLTLKALRVLQDADIVFYDSLVGAGVLDLIRRDADRVFVGKRRANHAVPQNEIHTRLVTEANAGRRVVRLKGGDPFVFGRGGEELDALRAAGVEAFVVPGVSSALGAAAASGVALTHRDHAQAVTFVTGHAKDGAPDLDWPALARANQTVVVFMGVAAAPSIAGRLLAAGRAAATPACVVENASLPTEKIVFSTLASLAADMSAHAIIGPALLIIGEVAGPAAARAIAASPQALEIAA